MPVGSAVVHFFLEEIPAGEVDCSRDGCLRDAEYRITASSGPAPRREIVEPMCAPCIVERAEEPLL